MSDRLEASKKLMNKASILCATIDDVELCNLQQLLDYQFGYQNKMGNVVIRNNPSGRSTTQGMSIAHEYALLYSNFR